MNRNVLGLLTILSLFFSFTTYAQNKLPAQEAFTILQNRYTITISYASDDLRNLFIDVPNKNASLDEALGLLNMHPLLTFKRIDEKRVAVALKLNNLSFCGEIIDAFTGQKLQGATIFISAEKATITDEYGQFNLSNVDKKDEVSISYLGYLDQQIKFTNLFYTAKGCVEIKMYPVPFELNEVILTNYLTSGLDKRLDGSIDVNTKKLGILPGMVDADILQAIQVLPGIESVNESIADINIRGGTHDQNLIVWDHIKMYHSGHFFGLISAFNPELTKNINIIKNGTSAALTDGVSGTLYMKSDDEILSRFRGSIGSNLLSTDASLQIPITKKTALHITGRRSFTDYYTSPTYNSYFSRTFQDSRISNSQDQQIDKDSEFFFYDFSGKFLYNINDKHALRTSFIHVKNELRYSEIDNSSPQNPKTSSLIQKNTGVGIIQISKWSPLFKTELQGYYTLYNLDALDLKSRTFQSLRQLNQVIETAFKLNTHYRLSDYFSWLNGYQYTETGAENASDIKNPTYQIIKKRVVRNHGAFSECTFSKASTFIRAGIRANYFERFGKFLIEPRVSLHQKLTGRFSTKIQGEFKHQTTSQFVDLNEDFLGVENRRWVVSDLETIPITKSKQISLGFDYDYQSWYTEITGYYKRVSDIISESQGFRAQNQYDQNIGSYTSFGIEFLVTKRFKKGNAWISYTYGDHQYQFDEILETNFRTNFDITHSFSAAFNYEILKNWKLSTGYLWRTGRPFAAPIEGNETFQDGNFRRVNYGVPNDLELPHYSRFDLSTSYILKSSKDKSLTIQAGILNVLNRENIINRYYIVSNSDENSAQQIDNVSLGFTPNASIRFTF